MALSSSGQDGALSRLKLGFESRQGHLHQAVSEEKRTQTLKWKLEWKQ
jgi:hypothetical protein